MTTKRIVGVKVTGELKQWQRKTRLSVSGLIDGNYEVLVLRYELIHYPEGKEAPEHYLARTTTGDYYLLKLDEEVL